MNINSLSRRKLEEIRKRFQATTPGPWVEYLEERDQLSGESFIARGENRSEDDLYLIGATDADIEFIAKARQDIPLLIEMIDRLLTLLEMNGIDPNKEESG